MKRNCEMEKMLLKSLIHRHGKSLLKKFLTNRLVDKRIRREEAFKKVERYQRADS